MWQKLKRIDVFELKKASTQLINAAQLVNAASISFADNSVDNGQIHLNWDNATASLTGMIFGSNEKVKVALDIEQYILSIYGTGDHIEHLVISGITYPMAFGWMRIKLDTFQVNGECYNDQAPYAIANPLGEDDEMYVTDQQVFSDLTIYFSNAFHILNTLQKSLKIQGKISVDPANLQMVLKADADETEFGFSPGDSDFLEPYFFIRTGNLHNGKRDTVGIPYNKNWSGYVFPADEFLKTDADQEYNLVYGFFMNNAEILLKSGAAGRT